jgi:hypothetical protein
MDEQPQQQPAIPWYKSKIATGLAFALVTDLVHLFHLTNYLSADQIAELADIGLQVAGFVSIIYAARGRLQQKGGAPLTLTSKKADTINALRSHTPPPNSENLP